ncbi:MAG: protein tyrosine kinase modulator [Acidobacteriota bacterium]|jgi:polysaccharide chain length determinant protein (PEP-CTERM system associated)|nr:protein tyrosine kinase modulator [Acidobacteriota bacterium]
MNNLTLSDLLRAVRRRPLWLIVPVLLGLAAAWGALRLMTPIYRASTLVMVEKQKVPADYVKATVTSGMEERLSTIEQQITNRSNLERIVEEMNLYPELRTMEPIENVVGVARANLTVAKKGDSVFTIFFKDPDPVKAANTANRVAELFILENLKLRENQAQGTSSFLEAELAETKQKLELQEAKIAAFKSQYMGQLPEQRDTNLQAVGQLQDKLEINMDALDKAETRKIILQREIAELSRPVPVPQVQMPSAPSGPKAPTRLEQLQAQLAELRSRYTAQHPDVIRLEAEIEQVRKIERGQQIDVSEAPAMPPPPQTYTPRADPRLLAQVEAVDMEIRSLQGERARILADIGNTQVRLENVPRVEQQLLSLTRDYDNIQRSYESLLAKRIDAKLAENLEKSRQSEQFNILEKAIPPADPYSPNRLLFLVIGLAGGTLLGMVSAFLREQTDSTFAEGDALQNAFPGVHVLATIPQMTPQTGGSGELFRAAAYGRFRRS